MSWGPKATERIKGPYMRRSMDCKSAYKGWQSLIVDKRHIQEKPSLNGLDPLGIRQALENFNNFERPEVQKQRTTRDFLLWC